MDRLTLANKALEQEKQRYRHELDAATHKLNKYKHGDNLQNLRDKLVKIGEVVCFCSQSNDTPLIVNVDSVKECPQSDLVPCFWQSGRCIFDQEWKLIHCRLFHHSGTFDVVGFPDREAHLKSPNGNPLVSRNPDEQRTCNRPHPN